MISVGGLEKSEYPGVFEGVLKDCFFNCGKNKPDI
jgi:hypothetical protein